MINDIQLKEKLLEGAMYRECAKECSWSSWCPYYNSGNFQQNDRVCGFTEDYVKLLASSQIETINKMGQECDDYINGLCEFIKFIDRFLERITYLLDKEVYVFYSYYANFAYCYSFIESVKGHLYTADRLISTTTKTYNSVILVEGQSEQKFVENILNSGYSPLIPVYCYQGEGNAGINKIHLLIDFYLANGYFVYFQLDLDNKNNKQTQLDKLKRKYSDQRVRFFSFECDLEQAYSSELMSKALNLLKIDNNLSDLQITPSYKEYLKSLGININNIKIDLADVISKIIIQDYGRLDNFTTEEVSAEIFKFYKFIYEISSNSAIDSILIHQ